MMGMESELERFFDTRLRQICPQLPEPEKHYRFHPARKWEFDRAWPAAKVAAEMEGGLFGKPIFCQSCGSRVMGQRKDGSLYPISIGGWGHRGMRGVLRDIEKYNAAAILGWIVFRVARKPLEEDPRSLLGDLEELIMSRLSHGSGNE